MTCAPRIRAVGVVVPARDEEHSIGPCLLSVRRALDRLPAGTATAVAVVLDRCADRTPERVAALLEGWPEAVALRVAALGGRRAGSAVTPGPAHIVAGSGVGALRELGVRAVLDRLRRHPRAATWLLHTDADTVVPPNWALTHLRHADAGSCGVAGLADLDASAHLAVDARRRYRAVVRDGSTEGGTDTSTGRTSGSAPMPISRSAGSRPTARARTTGSGTGYGWRATRSSSRRPCGCGPAPGCGGGPRVAWPISSSGCTATPPPWMTPGRTGRPWPIRRGSAMGTRPAAVAGRGRQRPRTVPTTVRAKG